jgi:single-stranded DNA-binding protein
MYIKGLTEFDRKGNEVKTACIFGKATRDGEVRKTGTGKNIASVSVKAYGKKDGSAEFVTIKAWDGPFLKPIGNTEKGDVMMACGRLVERKYNDKACDSPEESERNAKTYVDMIVDYYMRVPANGDSAENFGALSERVSSFNESDDDGELPF